MDEVLGDGERRRRMVGRLLRRFRRLLAVDEAGAEGKRLEALGRTFAGLAWESAGKVSGTVCLVAALVLLTRAQGKSDLTASPPSLVFATFFYLASKLISDDRLTGVNCAALAKHTTAELLVLERRVMCDLDYRLFVSPQQFYACMMALARDDCAADEEEEAHKDLYKPESEAEAVGCFAAMVVDP